MQDYAKGLKLEVTDREAFHTFIEEYAFDPGVHFDTWGDDSVPTAIYIGKYYKDDDPPYYRAYDEHVNGVISTHYWGEDILQKALNNGVLENTETYDIDFIESQGE